nr:hypothetical protein [uncultured Treponema sp.]
MKKQISLLLISLLITSCVSSRWGSDSLRWGMDLESFERTYITKEKIETDLYSIIYLPKNSVYKNEFDEYLLFANDIWLSSDSSFFKHKKRLIRRLQVIDFTLAECKEKIKKLNSFSEEYNQVEKEFEFPLKKLCNEDDAILGFEDFPSENSIPAIFLLLDQPYNYAIGYKDEKYLKSHSYVGLFGAGVGHGGGSEYCTGIFFKNGKNFILSYDSNSNSFFNVLYSYADYSNSRYYQQFLVHIDQVKLSRLQERIAGPFGTFWGMNKDDLYLICKKDSQLSKDLTDIRTLNEKLNYSDYYTVFKYSGSMAMKKFVPQKRADSISEYYAAFDSSNGLYQVFTIVNHSRALNPKEMYENSEKNQNAFKKMKSVLTEQYGKPIEKSNNSVYWMTDMNIKIELFSESKLVKLYSYWDGKEYGGQDDFTCLVYTDSKKYETLLSSEKKAIEKDKKEQSDAAEKKATMQKSYF